MFMARSMSSDQLLHYWPPPFDEASVPTLEGEALDMYQSSYTKERYEQTSRLPGPPPFPRQPSNMQFTHQLFHDAESIFWVMVWVLVRSASQKYQTETEWPGRLRSYISLMRKHRPSSIEFDYRGDCWYGFLMIKPWKQIAHPDLKDMLKMLAQMHQYVAPEWAYWEGLKNQPDHLHEALMRLLLTEIVRIRHGQITTQ